MRERQTTNQTHNPATRALHVTRLYIIRQCRGTHHRTRQEFSYDEQPERVRYARTRHPTNLTEKLTAAVGGGVTGDAILFFPFAAAVFFLAGGGVESIVPFTPARHPGRPPAWARTPWPPPSPGWAGGAAAAAAVRLEAAHRRNVPTPLSKPKLIALAAAAAPAVVGRGSPGFHHTRRQDNILRSIKQASKVAWLKRDGDDVARGTGACFLGASCVCVYMGEQKKKPAAEGMHHAPSNAATKCSSKPPRAIRPARSG